MVWKKLGRVFKTDENFEWMVSHSAVPVVKNLKGDVYRVYFGTRDKKNHAQIAYLDIDINYPENILEISKEPALRKGDLGTFDEEGVFPSSYVYFNNSEYLYYVGWNNHSVPGIFQTSVGVSKKTDDRFEKLFKGPIMDRSIHDPTLIATFDILEDNGILKMWYTSGTEWKYINDKLQSFYHIKYAYSNDGIEWIRDGKIIIDFKDKNESNIGRPTVLKENGLCKMWYCYASANKSYRIGYAESMDGLEWTRLDDKVGIDVSENGWDSEMIAYPNVFIHKGKKYMLYCGNNYGKEGFGLAVLEDE